MPGCKVSLVAVGVPSVELSQPSFETPHPSPVLSTEWALALPESGALSESNRKWLYAPRLCGMKVWAFCEQTRVTSDPAAFLMWELTARLRVRGWLCTEMRKRQLSEAVTSPQWGAGSERRWEWLVLGMSWFLPGKSSLITAFRLLSDGCCPVTPYLWSEQVLQGVSLSTRCGCYHSLLHLLRANLKAIPQVLFKASVCVGGVGGYWTTYGVEDRAVLVLAVLSCLSSRGIASLCREVSQSPLEAIEHYCPYLPDEEIEVAQCQAGGKTQGALLLVATGQGVCCVVAELGWQNREVVCVCTAEVLDVMLVNERDLCPNPLKASVCVFMGIWSLQQPTHIVTLPALG